ncbi:MAG TPA: hypothetical protein VFY39_08255, partial [Gammaproteobacteria bacterium]|nr:hypothetical protein [Gammaproteobacteria bacterium]
MIRATIKVAIGAAVWYGAAICSVALGQANDKGDAGVKPPPHVEDEIVVRGRTPAELRLQMQIAEDAVYGRFNEIDSNDEFDI